MRIPSSILLLAALTAAASPQSSSPTLSPRPSTAAPSQAALPSRVAAPDTVIVPAGTKVLLSLIHPISTKAAKPGDGVYLKTSFPVTVNNEMILPPGTFVQGEITDVQRPGRVKGRAELRFRFTTLIFPSGYTVYMPAVVENIPAMEHSTVTDKEGTVTADGQKGKDAGTVAGTAVSGAVIGAETAAIKGAGVGTGAGIGGAIGAAVGTGIVLLTRGQDVRLEPGTAVEMVFERNVPLDRAKLSAPAASTAVAQ